VKNRKKKQDVVVVVNVKKLVLFLVTVLLCVLALLSVLHTVKQFLKLRRFEVEGVGIHYEEVDLINASGIRLGDRLYRLDKSEIEDRLLADCPFLEEVTVKTRFPNRLRIVAKERTVPWYIEISGAKYALDRDLLVIDELGEAEEMAKLILPSVRRVIAGSVPEFANGEAELRRTLEAIAVIRSAPFYYRLTEIDLSNVWDIRIVADETFVIKLGDGDNLAAKLDAVQAIFESDRLLGATGATITASDPAGGVAVMVTKEMEPSKAPEKGD
jgi:hypothetical protein